MTKETQEKRLLWAAAFADFFESYFPYDFMDAFGDDKPACALENLQLLQDGEKDTFADFLTDCKKDAGASCDFLEQVENLLDGLREICDNTTKSGKGQNMKNYYYCNADMHIYTEKEKSGAIYPAGRFEFIGAFKSRAAAEKEQYSAYLAGKADFPCQPASRTIYTAAGCCRK